MANEKTKVFLLPIKGREAELQQLRNLIKQAGCHAIGPDAQPSEYEQWIKAADVIVVLICPETMNDPAVDNLVISAIKAGKRVVGVWLPGTKDAPLPAIINAHADAVIVSDVQQIRQSVCGDQTIWSTPEGTPRPTPKTPRHKG